MIHVNERNDFVIFQTIKDGFLYVPTGTEQAFCGQKYIQLGVNSERVVSFKEGLIS